MSQPRITGLERWLAHVQYVKINTCIFRFKSMYSRPQVKFSHVICEYHKYIYDIWDNRDFNNFLPWTNSFFFNHLNIYCFLQVHTPLIKVVFMDNSWGTFSFRHWIIKCTWSKWLLSIYVCYKIKIQLPWVVTVLFSLSLQDSPWKSGLGKVFRTPGLSSETTWPRPRVIAGMARQRSIHVCWYMGM